MVLTGGAENMSLCPYTLHGVRFGGGRYGVDLKLVDSLAAALTDMVPTPTPMGEYKEGWVWFRKFRGLDRGVGKSSAQCRNIWRAEKVLISLLIPDCAHLLSSPPLS